MNLKVKVNLKRIVIWGSVGGLFALFVYILIRNLRGNADFFTASITQILTLFTTLFVAFIATQFRNDQIRNKEHAEKIIQKIQVMVCDDLLCNIDPNIDKEIFMKNIMMKIRKLNNSISILKQYGSYLSFTKEVEYIDEQFKLYRDTISNHINDMDYLHKSEIEFRKYTGNIDSKCDEIIIKLYK